MTPPLSELELIAPHLARPSVSHVIFDFDGTLSWLRHGWPDIMLRLFLEHLPRETGHSEETAQSLRRDILSLNGKPSIHQVLRFCDRARELSSRPVPAPDQLLAEYQRRLAAAIRTRTESLQSGASPTSEFLICGAGAFLDRLRERELTLVILSGTAEEEVIREARLLGLTRYFGRHIYGSAPGAAFSKKDVIERILREEQIEGTHLLAFGDGPVEIQFAKAAGGLAIGVASDEQENGSHRVDPLKREQLVAAGADAIVADYASGDALLAAIFNA